jgi:hypothetical protein
MERRARAESRIWFEDPAMGCASNAIAVSDGRVQIVSKGE